MDLAATIDRRANEFFKNGLSLKNLNPCKPKLISAYSLGSANRSVRKSC